MNEAFAYARSVLDGEISSCEFVKYSAQRFIDDLERSKKPDFQFYFNEHHADTAINFIESLEHTKGALAGKPLLIQPWQKFIVANIFGWLYKDGQLKDKRRFTSSYVEVPRKNGKSTLASAIALCAFFLDGEQGAEVYSAATKLAQASIVFDESARVCKQVEMLKDETDLKVYNSVNNRVIKYGDSVYKPLEWSPKTQDGLNTHFAIVDEYHAHISDELYNLIKNSMGSRTQPHLHTVTTAGYNKTGPCAQHRKYCIDVLRGLVEDSSIFVVIYTIDEGDDWKDLESWKKANPNFGHSNYPRKFEEEFTQAMQRASKEVEFKTKLLNIWTDSAEVWLRDTEIKAVEVDKDSDALRVGPCYVGLDLAATSDFNALTVYFPETSHCFTEFFIPEDSLLKRNDATGDAIRQWVADGYINTTEGNVSDYDFIKARIDELATEYEIKEIAYDRWNATQLVIGLTDDGHTCYQFGQGYRSMSAPTKQLERLVKTREITIEENPCLRWMFSNIRIARDPADSIKIDKEKSGDKVDGPISIVMALGLCLENDMREASEEKQQPFFIQKL